MLNWGIVGAGNIAHRITKSLKHEPDSKLLAVSCRTEEKARAFAQQYDVERAYGGHDLLLKDPDIDIVYIALPHGLHKEYVIKALRAHKAVLCEKPAVLNASEMEEIKAVAKEEKCFFMEAMKTRFVPMYQEIKQMLASGKIGQVQKMHMQFCTKIPESMIGNKYVTDPGQGGCLLDMGCYCTGWMEDYLDNPKILSVETIMKYDVDFYTKAVMTDEKIVGEIECALDRTMPRDGYIVGTKGTMEIINMHRPEKVLIHYLDGTEEVIEHPLEIDDFYDQIHHTVECVKNHLNESPIMPMDTSISCAALIDLINENRQ